VAPAQACYSHSLFASVPTEPRFSGSKHREKKKRGPQATLDVRSGGTAAVKTLRSKTATMRSEPGLPPQAQVNGRKELGLAPNFQRLFLSDAFFDEFAARTP
jgi:hypothetical protein